MNRTMNPLLSSVVLSIALLAGCGDDLKIDIDPQPSDAASSDAAACTDPETRPCYPGPPGTEGVGICMAGEETCSGGQFGDCEGVVLPIEEIADGDDNDCDGMVDEGFLDAGIDAST